ncbi:MAG: MBL fold metallo-hydrolase [Pseudomonadota bacterium]
MSNSVSVLGVKGGPAIRPGSNMPTSILLQLNEKTILVDAGLGVSKAICDQGIELTQIDAIFVTHLHSDHYLELGPLIHTAWVSGLNRALPIYGPSRLALYWAAFLQSMEDDISLRIEDEGRIDLAQLVSHQTLQDGETIELDDIVVHVMRNEHPPIYESFALRFETDGKVVVLSGDTAYMPKMVDFARNADLLVHEAMLVDGVDVLMARQTNGDERLKRHILRSHTAAEDVGRIARDAAVKQLALNHYVPDGFPEFSDTDWEQAVRQHWDGPLLLAKDGSSIAIQPSGENPSVESPSCQKKTKNRKDGNTT